MKRFYRTASVAPVDGGWQALLDDRPVRTPARAPLIVPDPALADGIAAEWAAQGDTIAPGTMRLTGIANAAIDLVAPDPAAFAAPLAAYGESDLLCYRAPDADLAAEQAAAWDPVLSWAEARFGVEFAVTTGIVHVAQPPATAAALAAALSAQPPFALAALSPVIGIGGSLVAALALAEAAFTVEELWAAVTIDERWQAQRWGEDADAAAMLAARHADWMASATVLGLLH